MRAAPKLPPKPRSPDPRKTRGFCPRYYPKLQGDVPATANSRIRRGRIEQEFLAAYYEMNHAYADLLQARKLKSPAVRARRERLLMQRIERTLRRRDALEDLYAPLGIVVEPTMRRGLAVGLRFSAGGVAPSRRVQSGQVEMFSAEVPIPVPSDFAWDRLVRGVHRALEVPW